MGISGLVFCSGLALGLVLVDCISKGLQVLRGRFREGEGYAVHVAIDVQGHGGAPIKVNRGAVVCRRG